VEYHGGFVVSLTAAGTAFAHALTIPNVAHPAATT
jgi:hypothetical protein